ncbi:MAG: hypothetical protein ACRCZF_08605, partial [Gemmataceae bacterium]
MQRQCHGIGWLVFLLVATPVLAGDIPADRAEALARYGAARMQLGRDQLPAAVQQLKAAVAADPMALAPKRDLVTLYSE